MEEYPEEQGAEEEAPPETEHEEDVAGAEEPVSVPDEADARWAGRPAYSCPDCGSTYLNKQSRDGHRSAMH